MSDMVIVIDVQNGFVNAKAEHVVKPIASFLERWLKEDDDRLAVFTRFHNPPGSKWEQLIHWDRLRMSPEVDLVADMQRLIDDGTYSRNIVVADKETYTSLTPQVRDLIRKRDVKRLYLCGIATDGCVLKTAIDAFEEGDLVPVILTDLCASHAGPAIHDAGLLLAGRFIGSDQLLTAADIY